jgi:hypothetical protein
VDLNSDSYNLEIAMNGPIVAILNILLSDYLGMSDDRCASNDSETKVGDGGQTKLDQYLDAISEQRRRYVFRYLKDHESAPVSEIAKHVKAYETSQPPSTLTEHEYSAVQSDLQHNHLPRLADYGLLNYDARTGDVSFDEAPQTFMLLISLCELIESQSA